MSPIPLQDAAGATVVYKVHDIAKGNGLYAYRRSEGSPFWNVAANYADVQLPLQGVIDRFITSTDEVMDYEHVILLKGTALHKFLTGLGAVDIEENLFAIIEVFDLWENDKSRPIDPADLDPLIDGIVQETYLCYRGKIYKLP
jgi:hypothetical protein